MYQAFACNLGARLHTSTRMWRHAVGGHHLLFAPDAAGLPVLVTERVVRLLQRFNSGATVGEVMSSAASAVGDFDSAVTAIGFLEERGFLRSEPDPPTYAISAPKRLPTEMTVWLHITNSCNLGCYYCFVRDKTPGHIDQRTLNCALDRIVSTIQANGLRRVTIKLAGGEPTLAIGLMEHVYDYILARTNTAETDVRFAVLTNGTLMSRRILDFLRRPRVGIGISVDGYGADHNAHRVFKGTKQGSWEFVSRTVEGLLESGIKPYIMATLTPESMPGIDKLITWLLTHGLVARLNVVRPSFDNKWDDEARQRSAAQLASLAIRAFDVALSAVERWSEPVDVVNRINLCELSFNYPLKGPACGIGRSHVVVNRNGMLADCVMKLDGATTECSDNLLLDVQRTVRSTQYDADSIRRIRECLECRWYPVCGAGCPTFNARVTGCAFTRSPLCRFYQAVIPRYLECVATQQLRIKRMDEGVGVQRSSVGN